MKMSRSLKYFIAIVLAIIMFIYAIPLSISKAFADEVKNAIEESSKENTFVQPDKIEPKDIDDSAVLDEAYIIDENAENRTPNSKEFKMSDGSVVVQSFAQNIHYFDGDTFEEIDNTLVETKNENGKDVYENKSNFYKVRLIKAFAPNEKFVEIENNGYGLNFTYIDNLGKQSVAKKQNVLEKISKEYRGKKIKKPQDHSTGEGKVFYDNIGENIDLEYEIKDNGIKENIIVKNYLPDYDFDFKIEAKNLELQKNTDGSISAIDNSGNIKYVIPAPFMYDANGEYNYDVNYLLNRVGTEYKLTISADEDWIEKYATLPVTIDPIIETINNTSFSYVNVYEKGTGTQSTSEVYVGEKDSGNKSNAFFRFGLTPKGNNYTIVNATIRFHHKTEGMGLFAPKNIKYSVNVVDSKMPLSEITYANKPPRMQFLKMMGADTNLGSTELTTTLDLDLNTIKGDAVTISFERESANSSGGYVRIYTTGEKGVYLTLRYMQMTGIDESYSMESSDIGGVTAYVNKANGLLTVNCNFASLNNNSELPLKSSLVYNTSYNDIFTELGVTPIFGNDFKLNFQQYVKVVENQYVTLYDADGSITTLNFDTGFIYRSSDGKLTAKVENSNVTIYDASMNTRFFSNGLLKEIFKGDKTEINLVYMDSISINYVSSSGADAKKISEVSFFRNTTVDAFGKIAFTYTNGRVSQVTTYQGTTAIMVHTLTYDSVGNLITVKNVRADVNIYNLEYEDSGHLEAIYNNDKDGLYFSRQPYDVKVWKMQQAKGSNSDNATWYDYKEFIYDYNYYTTQTKHYENGHNVANAYACFDAMLKPISEWVEEPDGRVTGINRGYNNFVYSQNGYLYNYTLENIGFEEKLNTTFTNVVSLSTGQTASGTVTASSGITNNSHYKYGLTFFVEGRLGIDLTVTFGGQSKRVALKGGGKLYVTLPCGYVQSGTFVFKNNGSTNSTKISNVTYNVIDYVKETKAHSPDPSNKDVYATIEVISYNRKGEYEKRTYDGYQRLKDVTKNSIQDTVSEVTTYTYATSGMISVDQCQTETTKRASTAIISRRYSGSYNSETNEIDSTTITDSNGLKKSTQKIKNTSNGCVIIEKDENGVQTEKTYGVLSGDVRLKSIKSGDVIEKYTYDYLGNVVSITLVNASNETVLSTHNTRSSTSETYSMGGQTFNNVYDTNGYITDIKHGENVMLHYDYNADRYYSYYNDISKKTYANGQTENYTYSLYANSVTHKKSDTDTNTEVYTYNNDSFNRQTSSSYAKNGTELLNYNYGDLNNREQSTFTATGLTYGAQYIVNYNEVLNRVISTSDKFTKNSVDTTFNTSYAYNYKGQLTNNSVGTYNSSVTYDTLDRLSGYVAKNSSTAIINQTYVYDSYTENSTTYTTKRIKSITDNVNNTVRETDYDQKGYVSSVQYNGKTYVYMYDDAGRLAYESTDNDSMHYTYNNYNAITKITTSTNDIVYSYDTYGRITSYANGTNTSYFRYDAMGNPTMYKGASSDAGNNFVWSQGRKLESGYLNTNTFSYAYDMNGMRYQKTVNGNVTEYYLDGSTIIAENRKVGTTDNLIYYIYDMMGLSGMVYNGENYYYEKNTLGDIIGIRNSLGQQVATYTYDAWGNILTKTGTMADINPFRYRGYYYDNETGFYYLQTRYYDPSIRLFINADNYELTSTLAQTIGQLNLYAYANNNPIMCTDGTGEGILTAVILFVVGAAFAASASAFWQYATTGSVDWRIVGIAALFGGASWLLGAAGVGGVLGQFLIQGGLSVGETMVTSLVSDTWDQLSIDGLILEFVFSGMLGTIGAKGANREFKRILQIEKSLTYVLKRDFTKKGIKGLVSTWGAKSGKYTKVIKAKLKDDLIPKIITTIADIIVLGG